MMIIAHRGNLEGPNPEMENKPEYIEEALKQFEVEIDVWFVGGELYLGHDKPTYVMPDEFIYNNQDKLWLHCKNIEAAEYFFDWNLNYFWHQNDDISIINNNYLWTYTGKQLTNNSIAVLPEKLLEWDISNAYGLCTDYPIRYKNGTL